MYIQFDIKFMRECLRKAQGLHPVHGGSDEKDANVVKIKIESVSDLTSAEEKRQWKEQEDRAHLSSIRRQRKFAANQLFSEVWS